MLAALLLAPVHATPWKTPSQDVLDVLHAPQLPWVWTAPSGDHLLLADVVVYPPLADYAAGWLELAGTRIDPQNGGRHADPGGTSPRIVSVHGGTDPVPLPLPEGAQLQGVAWTADGERFALTVELTDRFGLWVGDVDGAFHEVEGVALNPMLGDPVSWMPDQERLLVRQVPERGPMPEPPAIPAGPMTAESSGGAARSTYEARNLLQTAHDEALFEYFATSELVVLDPDEQGRKVLGDPAPYATARPSPDGRYLLIERLVAPWSHEVAWWRFGSEVEVWDKKGRVVAEVATLPLADNVPAHGVPEGVRRIGWQATAPHTLFWTEALDGGDPVAEVPHRDRLMRLEAPFDAEAEEVFRAEHRIQHWRWAEDHTLMLTERERMRRWQTTWLLDVDEGTKRLWFERNEKDRYGSPGAPVMRRLDNGFSVLRQQGDAVYFD